MFASQKERKMTMLPLHQAALILPILSILLHPLLLHSKFLVPSSIFFRLAPGLEPCSPHSQSGTLPDKLKPTFVIEDRFELSSPDSESGMLPLHHSTLCGSYGNRTRCNRSTICDVSRYTNEPL